MRVVAAGVLVRAMAWWMRSSRGPMEVSRLTASGSTRGMAMTEAAVAVDGRGAELGFEVPGASLHGVAALPGGGGAA